MEVIGYPILSSGKLGPVSPWLDRAGVPLCEGASLLHPHKAIGTGTTALRSSPELQLSWDLHLGTEWAILIGLLISLFKISKQVQMVGAPCDEKRI